MITFQIEKFKDVKDETMSLAEDHYKEIAADKDTIELNPYIEGYFEMEKLGGLIIVTARDDEKLIGYSFYFTQRSLHYFQLVVAINDLFYVSPDYRGSYVGSKLIKKAEEVLKQAGVHQIRMHTKVYANFAPLLIRDGFEENEVVYKKNINIPE